MKKENKLGNTIKQDGLLETKIDEKEDVLEIAHGEDVMHDHFFINVPHEVLSDDHIFDQCNHEDDLHMNQNDDICHGNDAKLKYA